jgi:hypothetical protein
LLHTLNALLLFFVLRDATKRDWESEAKDALEKAQSLSRTLASDQKIADALLAQ